MKKSFISKLIWVVILMVVCLFFAIFIGETLKKFEDIKVLYGPPEDSISTFDKLYFAAMIWFQKEHLTIPTNPSGKDIVFKVGLGESATSISDRLQDLELINDPGAFQNYLVYSGIDRKIQVGNFILNSGMTPVEIARKLQDSTPQDIVFSILPGWRAEEIAATIPTSGLEFSSEAFLEAVRQYDAEGYLLPGFYTFTRDISAEFVVQTLVDSFNTVLSSELRSGFDQRGLSIPDAVVLASIVEKESIIDDEMPLIASVFLNRLQAGMLLNADPTIQYALGYNESQQTWWTNPLSSSDLMIDTPFNTYLYSGLPPGPICNPSENAIRAIAFPAQTPYYYFRADCKNTGYHNFAVTLEEHIENACP